MAESRENKVWSAEDIVNNASNWSLSADKELLRHLQDLSEKLLLNAAKTNDNLVELLDDLDKTALSLDIANIKLGSLHHTQFIESRVYEDDDEFEAEDTKDVPPVVDKKGDEEKTRNEVEEGILEAVKAVEEYYEYKEVPNSYSDDEDDSPNFVWQPKDPYLARPLPYVIGTTEWYRKWHVGLLDDSSDDEDVKSDVKTARAVKDDIDSQSSDDERYLPPLDRRTTMNLKGDNSTNQWRPSEVINIDRHTGLNPIANSTLVPGGSQFTESSEESNSLPVKEPSASFAEQLAQKLGNVAQAQESTKPLEINTKPMKKPPINTNVSLFFDEPPPLNDDSESSEGDDIFGNTGGLFGRSKTGLFDDPHENQSFWGQSSVEKQNKDVSKASKVKVDAPPPVSSIFADDSESEDDMFAPKPAERMATSRYLPSAVTTRLPLFNDEPPELPKEQEKKKKPIGGVSIFGNTDIMKSGALIKNLRRASSSESRESTPEIDVASSINKSLEPERIENTHKDVPKTLEKKTTEPISSTSNKAVPENVINKEKINLFDENDSLFEDDLFSNVSAKKFTSSLFDDDDNDESLENTDSSSLFYTSNVSTVKKNDLFSHQTDITKDLNNSTQHKSSGKSNFDNPDDNSHIFESPDVISDIFDSSQPAKSLFDDLNVAATKRRNLFDDVTVKTDTAVDTDSIDVKKPEPTNEFDVNSRNFDNRKPTKSLFDDLNVAATKRRSLFDDIDELGVETVKTDVDTVKFDSGNVKKPEATKRTVVLPLRIENVEDNQPKPTKRRNLFEDDLAPVLPSAQKSSELATNKRPNLFDDFDEPASLFNDDLAEKSLFDDDEGGDLTKTSEPKSKLTENTPELLLKTIVESVLEPEIAVKTSVVKVLSKIVPENSINDEFKQELNLSVPTNKSEDSSLKTTVSEPNSDVKAVEDMALNDPIVQPSKNEDLSSKIPLPSEDTVLEKVIVTRDLTHLSFNDSPPDLDDDDDSDSASDHNILFYDHDEDKEDDSNDLTIPVRSVFDDGPPLLPGEVIKKPNISTKSEAEAASDGNIDKQKPVDSNISVVDNSSQDRPRLSIHERLNRIEAPIFVFKDMEESKEILIEGKSEEKKVIAEGETLKHEPITIETFEGSPRKSGAPGKIKHNLNINVAALLPGTSRKANVLQTAKSEEEIVEKSNNLDELDNSTEILQCITKDRAKIPVKRRPSTRKARQESTTKIIEEISENNNNNKTVELPIKQAVLDSTETDAINQNTIEKSAEAKQGASKKVANKSLFASSPESSDSDDIFKTKSPPLLSKEYNGLKAQSLFHKQPVIKGDVFESPDYKKSRIFFDDDDDENVDDYFSSKKLPPKSNIMKKNLFDDEEAGDDLFQSTMFKSDNIKPAKISGTAKKSSKLFQSTEEDPLDLFK